MLTLESLKMFQREGKLYGKKSFYDREWLDGIIVVAPTSTINHIRLNSFVTD